MDLYSTRPNHITNVSDIHRFGYKKVFLIQKFLNKITEDYILGISGVKFRKNATLRMEGGNFADEYLRWVENQINYEAQTVMVIFYESTETRGMYWDIKVKPQIEKLILDVFGLKSIGIDKIELKHRDKYIYY